MYVQSGKSDDTTYIVRFTCNSTFPRSRSTTMDGDRKYRHRGYQDLERGSESHRSERPRQPGPKLPIDVTGPKLPRLVQTVAAARCFNCSASLPPDIDFKG